MSDILFAILFFWPAGAANSAPVFASKIKLLNRLGIPIDGGKTFRGRRIFGDHKTVRGFLAGLVIGGVASLELMLLYHFWGYFRDISPVDYSEPSVIILGMVMGVGALTGDAVKSFFKRQVGVASGKSWFPFDQTDYIIGGIIASLYYIVLPWETYLIIALVWFILHPLATFVAWLLKLKDSPI